MDVFDQTVCVTEARLYWLNVLAPVEEPQKLDGVICCYVRSPLCFSDVGNTGFGTGWYADIVAASVAVNCLV